jgi:hypothetical protein
MGSLEPVQAVRRETALELGHSTEPRHIQVRGDIRERIQNEVPLHYPRMREHKV